MTSEVGKDDRFIGLAIAAFPRLLGVSQLSHAQNERLRRAMSAYKRASCDDNVTVLAKQLKRAQPSLSDFLNGKGGASYETAIRFSALVGKEVTTILGPRDSAPGEGLPSPGVKAQAPAPVPDLPMRTLLNRIALLPGLMPLIDQEELSVHEVMRGVLALQTTPSLARADGQPHEGWSKFIADVRSGRIGVAIDAPGTPDRAAIMERQQYPHMAIAEDVTFKLRKRAGKEFGANDPSRDGAPRGSAKSRKLTTAKK